MEISRRQFGRGALALATVSPFMGLTGCPATATIETDLNVLIDEAVNILAVIEPTASYLADLKAAVTALKAAEASWLGGSPAQVLRTALTTLLNVMAAIPEGVPYLGLAQLIVAGVVLVLNLLPKPAGALPAAMTAVFNPLVGKKVVTGAADSKAQWNAIVAANPALAVAKL